MDELVWTIALGVAIGIALYRFIYSTGNSVLSAILGQSTNVTGGNLKNDKDF